MNLARVSQILSGFLLFFSLVELVPLAVSWFEAPPVAKGIDAKMGFLSGSAIGLLLAGLFHLAGRGARPEFFRREALLVVALAWLLASGVGALPFLWSGALPTAPDALYESVSGLTTCGGTVFTSGPNFAVEDLPASILLWRALLHLMGGLGILLMFLVLLPIMGAATGKSLLASEATGVAAETLSPRMQEQAHALFRVYLGLIVLDTLGLWWLGMSGFDAFCHACATVATGGFSTRNYSIGQYGSVGIEVWTTAFMFLGACNFILLHDLVRARFRNPLLLWRNDEFRFFLGCTVVAVAFVAFRLHAWGQRMEDPALGRVHDYGDLLVCLREASFNVVSYITTTGFATVDFQNWPRVTILVLILGVLMGGCTGSTGGSVKALRVLVTWRLLAYSLRHFIRPKSVEKIKLDGEALSATTMTAVLSTTLLWLLVLAAGTLVMSLDPRLDLLSSLTANAANMANCGPALTAVRETAPGLFAVANTGDLNLGPYGGYGGLDGWTKLLLAAQMLFGRLEIYTLLAVLAPMFWRRT